MEMGGCSQGLAPQDPVGGGSQLLTEAGISAEQEHKAPGGAPHPCSPWEVWDPPCASGNSRKKRAAGERG